MTNETAPHNNSESADTPNISADVADMVELVHQMVPGVEVSYNSERGVIVIQDTDLSQNKP